MPNLIAQASITINAPVAKVWDALVNPVIIKQYFFGTNVVTDWKVGSPIVWKGEWEGKAYEDKGKVLEVREQQFLQFTHFSPFSGLPDLPASYHTVSIELTAHEGKTTVSLVQNNNADEKTRAHTEKNWEMVLEKLKKILEK